MRAHSYRSFRCGSGPRGGSVRLWLLVLLGGLFIFGLVLGLLLVWTVDDWSRDFSTNVAESDPQHPDPRMRCIVLPVDRPAAVEQVRQLAESLPGWRESSPTNDQELHFERTTRWFRFVDDITVRLTAVEDGTRVSVSSRSRIGQGDLGQNPRNIRELLGRLAHP